MEKNKSMFYTIKRFMIEGKETSHILILFFLYLIMSSANILISKGTGKIVNNAISFNMNALVYGLIILAIGKIIYSVTELISGILSCYIKEHLIICYRMLSIDKIIGAEYIWIQNLKKGDILGRMQDDVTVTAEAIAEFLPDAAKRILVALGVIAVLFVDNWKLGLAFLISIPFMFISQYFGNIPCQNSLSDARKSESSRDAEIQDVFNNKSTIKVFQIENKAIEWLELKIKDYTNKFTKSMMIMTLSFSPAMIISQLPTLLVCGIGAMLVINRQINLENFVTAFTLSASGANELNGITNIFANLPNMMSYSERLFPLWDAPEESNGKIKIESENYPLVFKNVSFSYPDQKKFALHDFNITIQSGKYIALVGPSGSGKSTVLKLAASLYQPTRGSITAWGVNLENWDKDSYRSKIAFVSQDTYLFPTTLKDNIKAGANGVIDEELNRVLLDARLQNVINKLPNGLEENIKEHGENLSGGQRQRISIARALVSKPKLLLLDEATSAIDYETEIKINTNLRTKYKDCTILISAHRLSSIIDADYILVMDEGNIVEEGTHDELLQKNGLYTKLYNSQNKGEINHEK